MTLMIGIAGKMRTGKSSLANALGEWLSQDTKVCVYSFAEPLRQELALSFFNDKPPTEARFWLNQLEEANKAVVRPLLQAWGQGRRDINGADYWVERLGESITEDACDIALIDDVRHPNEADYILNNGGILIRLNASYSTLVERGAEPNRLQHYSETAMNAASQSELINPHRVLTLNTSGLSVLGMTKALKPFLEEMIVGDDE